MIPLGNPREHFWLTLGMAKAIGVDFSVALHEKRITREAYSDIINACRGCDHADQCTALLAGAECALSSAPEYCVNREVMGRLAA